MWLPRREAALSQTDRPVCAYSVIPGFLPDLSAPAGLFFDVWAFEITPIVDRVNLLFRFQ
jgi:hypothetical protein